MVSAAKGAEQFYTIEHHASRSEGIELARERDSSAANVNTALCGKTENTLSPKNVTACKLP